MSSTSGTTGAPTFISIHSPEMSRSPTCCGNALRASLSSVSGPGDRVVQGFGLSMYLAGLPVVRALERMGATPFPVGAEAGSEKLLRMIQMVRPRVLACTPSYAEHLMERTEELLGTDAADLGIEIIVCAGEPGAGLPEVRSQTRNRLGGASVRSARWRSRDHDGVRARRRIPRHVRARRRLFPSPRNSLIQCLASRSMRRTAPSVNV